MFSLKCWAVSFLFLWLFSFCILVTNLYFIAGNYKSLLIVDWCSFLQSYCEPIFWVCNFFQKLMGDVLDEWRTYYKRWHCEVFPQSNQDGYFTVDARLTSSSSRHLQMIWPWKMFGSFLGCATYFFPTVRTQVKEKLLNSDFQCGQFRRLM